MGRTMNVCVHGENEQSIYREEMGILEAVQLKSNQLSIKSR